MIIAALTGGIASGKTEVLKVAKSFSGVETIQADKLAKEIYNPDNPKFQDVLDLFGQKILTDEQEVDKEKVANLVFSNPDLLKKLEKVAHPYVMDRIRHIVKQFEDRGVRLTLIEIPLLFQAISVGLEEFDLIVLVLVDEDHQVERLVKRDHISSEEAKRRIELQRLPDNAKEMSDYVIHANGTREETVKQATVIINKLLN